MSSPYDFSPEACRRDVRTFGFRGREYVVRCCDQQWHPSNWSFQDEVETRELWWRVEPGHVVMDVGADFGSYSLTALVSGAALVVAWSPPFKVPTVAVEAMTLRASAELNGWGDRINVLDTGLWHQPGWLAAFDGPRPAVYCDTRAEALATIEGQPVHCSAFELSTLDRYCAQDLRIQRMDWLKIDTEGCELSILVGAVRAIQRFKPRILLEHHYHIDPHCEERCDRWLKGLGYLKEGTRPHGAVAHSLYWPS